MASVSTDEDVVNIALARIGAKEISDLDTDTTAEAVEARRVYYNIRDRLMRSHHWNFLTKRAQLSDSGEDPVFGWDEGYTLPGDLLRLISVHATETESDQPDYKIEVQVISATPTKVLLINSSSCYIKYIYKETDPQHWPADFQDAVAWALAAELALVLPVSNADFELLKREADRALIYAKSVDGLEEYPQRFPPGDWVTDRDHGEDWSDW